MPVPFKSLDGAAVTGVGATHDLEGSLANHTMTVVITGAPTSLNVDLEISHDSVNWIAVGTASGSGAFKLVRGTVTVARYVRANLTVLTGGTAPTVTAYVASA